MNDQGLRFRIGVFVLSALILMAVLIMLFGSFPTLLKRHTEYTVTFNDAPGVAGGTPVRRSGVRIGEVRSVELDDATGLVTLKLMIEKPHSLYENDDAMLVHGLLSGDTTIDFVPKRRDGKPAKLIPLEPGTQIAGASKADVSTLINQTSEMVPNAQESLRELQKTLQRYEKMAPLVEESLKEYRDLARAARDSIPDLRRTNDELQAMTRTYGRIGERLDVLLQANEDKIVKTLDNINDAIIRIATIFSEENQRNLTALLRNARAGSENLEAIAKGTEELIKDSRVTMKRFNESFAKADEVLSNFQQASRPLAERAPSVMKNIDESVERLNRVLLELSDLLRAFRQDDGTLGRFFRDPALYNNVNEAACMLTRMMPRLDRILKDFEVFADKVARHPESLGLGGVVTPSAGLKEAPSGVFSPRH